MSPEQYQKFIQWWQQNVKTAADAKYGNAYFQQLLQKEEQDKLNSEAESAQNTAALTSIGGAIAAPVLYGAGTKAAGLLNLGGKEAAKKLAEEGTKTVAQNVLGNTAAGSTGTQPTGLMSVGNAGNATAGAPNIPGLQGGAPLANGTTSGGSALGTNTWGQFGQGGNLAAAGDVTGTAVAGYNLMDAAGNFGGDRKGVTEGAATTIGTGLGAFFGGPVGAGIGSVIGRTAGRGLNSVLGSAGISGWDKSTKDYQDERWGALSPELQGLRAANHPDGDTGVWTKETDPSGKYVGQEWTFEKAQDLAKDDPSHFIGVLGNAETFGNDWLGLEEDKQKQVVSQLVNQGLYNLNKGDVLIADENKKKAQDIYASIVNGGTGVDPNPQQPADYNQILAQMPNNMPQQNIQLPPRDAWSLYAGAQNNPYLHGNK